MISRKLPMLAVALSILSAPQAFAWTQLAQCGSLNQLDRATVYTDGAGIIVQLMGKGALSVEQEFRTVFGDELDPNFDPSTEMDAIAAGVPRAYVLKKESSSTDGDTLSEGAVLALTVPKKPTKRINSHFAHNGKVVSMYCNQAIDD